MTKCYVCGTELSSENCTKEHIFLNSIGGTLKPKNLICRNCNTTFGLEIDNELSKELKPFAVLLDIERDRNTVQKIVANTESGIPIVLLPGGKPELKNPIIKEENIAGKKHLSISARSNKEAIGILKGIKKKYPHIDYDSNLARIIKRKNYLNENVELKMSFGGPKAFRSISKIASNYYMYSGGNSIHIEDLVKYIKGEKSEKFVFWYLEPEVIKKNTNDIFHSIIIIGNNNEKLLYAYVEIFNFYQLIVIMNENYEGENLEKSYIFDVLNKKEIMDKDYALNIKRGMLNKIKSQSIDYNALISGIHNLEKIILNRQENVHINSMVQTVINNSLSKYDQGITMTEEMIQELVDELMKETTPWITHKIMSSENKKILNNN